MVGQTFALSMEKRNLSIMIMSTSGIFLKGVGIWDLIQRKYSFTDTKIWSKNFA